MKRLSKLSLKFWLIFGLVTRLALMPITFHPDILAINFAGYFFSFKKVFNIYDYLYQLPQDFPLVKNYGQNFFTYPPLAYFTLGLFMLLLKPFYNLKFLELLLNDLPGALKSSLLLPHLFLLKLPYLFFDLGIAFVLMKLFDDQQRQKSAFILWMINPLSFYTSLMIGQFDIIPLFFVILSLYFIKVKKPGFAAVSLGLGGSFKMFPLFFLPVLVLGGEKYFWKRMKLFFWGVLPFILTIFPFLSSFAFRQVVLFSGQSQKMLFAKIPVSGAEGISLFVFLFVTFCVWLAYFGKSSDFWQYYLLMMLLLFSLTHYHPQWFLWITPLLLIELVKNNFKHLWLGVGVLICWGLITFLFEPSLNIGLFLPFKSSFSFSELLAKFYDPFQFKSIIRSIFAGISLGMTYLLFK